VTADPVPHAQRDSFLAGAADDWFERNRGAPTAAPLSHFDEIIAGHLRDGGAMLEVGCSDGRRLRRIAGFGPHQTRLAGVEPSAQAVEAGLASDPSLELVVGTADDLPFADLEFDTVVVGFCLYVCDPVLLPRIVSEIDRVLGDGGTLAIIDFDPPSPRRRQYRHQPGLWSHKMDYAMPFLAYPAYSVAETLSISHHTIEWTADESERVACKVLKKSIGGGFSEESDV
jgi:SAM-dependent methyltransferase